MTLLIAIMLVVGLKLSWSWMFLVIPVWVLHTMFHGDR